MRKREGKKKHKPPVSALKTHQTTEAGVTDVPSCPTFIVSLFGF